MMTTVKMTNTNGYFRLEISGHAGYGSDHGLEQGHDIVCAAVSMLGQTAVRAIEDMAEAGEVMIGELHLAPGEIRIRATAKGKSVAKMRDRMAVIETGFRLLAVSYPKYVKT